MRLAAGAISLHAQIATPSLPRFEDYPVAEIFKGTPAAPILATPQQREYRTRIRNGVSMGDGVWYGSWRDPIRKPGPNFAGHYFVIRWGCGSQCVLMAIVDAKTGVVYEPPLSGDKYHDEEELFLPLDNLGEAEVDIRPDSSLMVLREACTDYQNRKTCGTYYFNWKDNHFDLLKFVYVNPLDGLR